MKTHPNIATTARLPFQAADPKERIILVDLHDVTNIDSGELALFMEAMHRINAHGGHLVLCGVCDEVRRVFATAKLDRVFQIFSTRGEALANQTGVWKAAQPSLN